LLVIRYNYNRLTKKLEPNKDKHIIEEIYQCYLNDMNLFEGGMPSMTCGIADGQENGFIF